MSKNQRLLFKFYRSYFDVACELSDKDRLSFYDAIMKKEFLGIEPNLKGSARFAYISQKHSIDAQVKGWEDYFKTQITDNYPMIPPMIPPMIQEEDKEEEKEKEQYTCFSFDEFWELYDKKVDARNCKIKYAKISEKDRLEIKMTLPEYLSTIKEKKYQKNPLTYLGRQSWKDEYVNSPTSQKPQQITYNPTNGGEKPKGWFEPIPIKD